MKAPSVTVQLATLYRVHVGLEWADCYLRDEGRRCALTIQSTLGAYAYTWSNIGEGKSFRAFLSGLDFTYFMQKTRPDYLLFDPEATARSIADDLLKVWRDGDLPAELALDCLDRFEDERPWEIPGADLFHSRLEATGIAGTLYQHDLAGIAKLRPRGECLTFWNELWPVLCDAWKRAETSGEREP